LRFGIKSAFSGEFLVVEEEKTYCYHKVLLEGGENYLEEELHKNKSLEGWLWSQGRAV